LLNDSALLVGEIGDAGDSFADGFRPPCVVAVLSVADVD